METKRCLSCYQSLDVEQSDYHKKCIKSFFDSQNLPILSFGINDVDHLAREAALRSISIQGVQPKLSLGWTENLSSKSKRLTILDALGGSFILKIPVKGYSQMPENEHLSMKLASLFKIDTVPFNMIKLASGELCYLSKRIDRNKNGSKNHMIDFMQIMELDDKYKGTMESLAKKLAELSINTLLDKMRFFELTVFNFLIGNNDMHLKNFSMFLSPNGWILSPAYDLLNVKIIIPKDKEDMALNFGGKKYNFNQKYFRRFALDLGLNEKQIQVVFNRTQSWLPKAQQLIDISFLNDENKTLYTSLITKNQQLFN